MGKNLEDLLQNREFVYVDGAMGTMLQQSGLQAGERPELLSLTHPQLVENIHRKYLAAGSDIVYANTFGANAHKLEGCGHSVTEVITASIQLAKHACADYPNTLTALDIGPIGELLAPTGTLSFDDAYEIYREMLTAGEQAGADLVVFETQTDLYEVKAAVLAAKEHTKLPIFVTMTFEENGRTFTGCSAEAMAETLDGLGIAAMGVNCSLGPASLLPIIQKIGACTDLPLIVKANAGLPDAHNGHYHMDAAQFAAEMQGCADLGVQIIGGCCGTTPAFIGALCETMQQRTCQKRTRQPVSRVCSATNVVTIDGVRVIGERINPTGKKRFQLALKEKDIGYILSQGVQQADAGAHILDVNVGLPGIDEPQMMREVVCGLQGVLDLPLQIDSSEPEAIAVGLRYYNGKAIVNSVNGKPEVLEKILPIVKKYGAAVVGLTLDEKGLAETAEEKFAIAKRILEAARAYGIPDKDVFIDCLTLTVSAQQSGAKETLKAVRMVKEQLGLHTVLGVSNISFGLPNRELVNRTFLTMAMENGLDLPILNPNIPAMMESILAFNVLDGADADSEAFIAYFQNAQPTTTAAAPVQGQTDIGTAIGKGLKEDARRLTQALLQDHEALEIVNGYLIPALDVVGSRFEKGEIFLPQLMKAADASCEAFEVIKTHLAKNGAESVSKGKIIVATVKGDIHDIGKNIVKTILANYGYQVIDLGRDVAPETVVERAIADNVPLIGLSALMTTTVGSMQETIAALRQSKHPCKIFVGGAVLTEKYAMEIGADYYAKDAKQSVDIAKEVLG